MNIKPLNISYVISITVKTFVLTEILSTDSSIASVTRFHYTTEWSLICIFFPEKKSSSSGEAPSSRIMGAYQGVHFWTHCILLSRCSRGFKESITAILYREVSGRKSLTAILYRGVQRAHHSNIVPRGFREPINWPPLMRKNSADI